MLAAVILAAVIPALFAETGDILTLQEAVDAARRTGEKRIILPGGMYFLESPLVLDPRDSGLSIEAAEGENVILIGGRRITGWQPDGEGLWAAKVPEVANGTWDFRMLVVNGRFCKRARLPKTGEFTHDTQFKVRWMSTTGGGWERKPTPEELTTMKYRAGDLPPRLEVKNAEVTVYHMWDESLVGIAKLDDTTHTMTFSTPTGHPPGAFGVQKYVVWNVREGMTEPGQWYLDRAAGKVVYWPLAGEDMAQAEVFAPTTETIIRLQGRQDAPVENVTLRGLTLSMTNTPLQAGGFGAFKFDGAISAWNVADCRLTQLRIVKVGGQGIKAQNCRGLRIENCEVNQSGACGIIIRGTDNVVEDCHVHHIGLTYPSAIGVSSSGQRNRFAHNEVHDTPYSGMTATGDQHVFERNLIHRAMLELHDGGGIYVTFCKGVVLRGNVVRDVPDTGGYGSSAYYLDEQAENCVVERNLSVNVARPSHNHMAKNNVIRQNVFIVQGDARLTFPKSEGYVLERNVIYATGKIAIQNPAAIGTLDRNLFYSGADKLEGVPPEVAQDDPLFEDMAAGKYGFKPDSPALKLGIEPIDVSKAGRRLE